MNLYDLTEQYQDLLALLEDGDTEQLQPMLDGIEEKIEEKLENIAKVLQSLKSTEYIISNELSRLTERKSAIVASQHRLKLYAQNAMEQLGIDKVKTDLFSIGIQNNPPSVHIVDSSKIPQEYFSTPEPTISKREILAALKTGAIVSGAELQQSKSLRVR